MPPAAINISPNPVVPFGTYAQSFGPGKRPGKFSTANAGLQAYGNFWSYRFKVHDTDIGLLELFNSGLNRHVEVRGETGETDFEGTIQTMRIAGVAGESKVLRHSLDDVATKIWMIYKDAAGVRQRTSVSDAAAAERYGIIELPISGGEISSLSAAQNTATQFLAEKAIARPLPESLRLGDVGGNEKFVEVDCFGYIRKLGQRIFNQTASTGAQSADLEIADILTAIGQYCAPAALWRLLPNTVGVTKVYDGDLWGPSIIFNIARMGDTLPTPQPWCFYFDVGRIPVYEPKAPAMSVTL